jgi:cytoskeleton protein RodZ
MTEPNVPGGSSAGAMLRAARERQGLHIAALAATIKIPQRKLEALESDRHDELPDATFTRALAMTVCRALKIDPAPVLAQLPQIGGKPLPDVAGGLRAPYRERPARDEPSSAGLMSHPLSWAALLVLVAAAVVLLLPSGWWQDLLPDSAGSVAPTGVAASAVMPAVAQAASAVPTAVTESLAAAPAPASAAAVEVVHSVSTDPEASASAAADAATGVAVLKASDASWVEVIDAGGQVLVQRVLQPGESLGLDGRLPFKLKIGNAAATQLQFKGQGVDLAPVTRDNVARLELK